jgi:hypothetical protein
MREGCPLGRLGRFGVAPGCRGALFVAESGGPGRRGTPAGPGHLPSSPWGGEGGGELRGDIVAEGGGLCCRLAHTYAEGAVRAWRATTEISAPGPPTPIPSPTKGRGGAWVLAGRQMGCVRAAALGDWVGSGWLRVQGRAFLWRKAAALVVGARQRARDPPLPPRGEGRGVGGRGATAWRKPRAPSVAVGVLVAGLRAD